MVLDGICGLADRLLELTQELLGLIGNLKQLRYLLLFLAPLLVLVSFFIDPDQLDPFAFLFLNVL